MSKQQLVHMEKVNGIPVVRNFSFGKDDDPVMGIAVFKDERGRINLIPVSAIDLLVTTRISKIPGVEFMIPEGMAAKGFQRRDVLGVIPNDQNWARDFLKGRDVTEIPKQRFRSVGA